MDKHPGSYLRTELDQHWCRRYVEDGFLARGAGEYWFEADSLCFQRFLTSKPLRIPCDHIRRTEIGTWHAGTWRLGVPIVKMIWEKDGHQLSAGIVVSRKTGPTQAFIDTLKPKIEIEELKP